MVRYFSDASNSRVYEKSFLNDHQGLYSLLNNLSEYRRKIILFGLSFALLDFVKCFKVDLENLIVIETGGMKNSNQEIDKDTLLHQLKLGFPKAVIHSEYGMTELISQAYSKDGTHYTAAPLMKFLITDPTDPTIHLTPGKRGIINVIDLGNLHTCSFLQTGDLGILNEQLQLEVLGRFKPEEVRGCVQMYE